MKFVLTDYQEDAVTDLLAEIEYGWDAYGKRGKLPASLTGVGSGEYVGGGLDEREGPARLG